MAQISHQQREGFNIMALTSSPIPQQQPPDRYTRQILVGRECIFDTYKSVIDIFLQLINMELSCIRFMLWKQ